jgi:hypothetical protein
MHFREFLVHTSLTFRRDERRQTREFDPKLEGFAKKVQRILSNPLQQLFALALRSKATLFSSVICIRLFVFSTMSEISPLPHLYGQLAKTSQGCEILRNCGHLKHFEQITKEPLRPAQSECKLNTIAHFNETTQRSIRKRAALWAIVCKLPILESVCSLDNGCFLVSVCQRTVFILF